jgi:hypothetical protein
MNARLAALLAAALFICLGPVAIPAERLIRYPAGSAEGDFRYAYPVRVLQLALDRTAREYGPAG